MCAASLHGTRHIKFLHQATSTHSYSAAIAHEDRQHSVTPSAEWEIPRKHAAGGRGLLQDRVDSPVAQVSVEAGLHAEDLT